MSSSSSASKFPSLTSYQKFVVGILAFTQFTVILDFMILSPLGALLIPTLRISPAQFGLVVSAYAFAAGISGFLSAGFADRFDRKKLLLFFYSGFVLGTLLCGVAPNYSFLLMARIVTGTFGGVIGSVAFATITDLFQFEVRGRVFGIIQSSFAASQVLGIPFGLFLSNHLNWHAPFMLIVAVSSIVGVVILLYMKPVDSHLLKRPDKSPLHHLAHIVSQPRYLQGFAATALLATGGFMLMPFGSAFTVHNMGVSLGTLPWVYVSTGVFSMIAGPIIGRLSDKFGKFQMFLLGSIITAITVTFYTRLGIVPLWVVIMTNVCLFSGISARMISASALISALPEPVDRGSYMSVSSSIQQISGGIAATVAGLIVTQNLEGSLENFSSLGNILVSTTFITVVMMALIDKMIKVKSKSPKAA